MEVVASVVVVVDNKMVDMRGHIGQHTEASLDRLVVAWASSGEEPSSLASVVAVGNKMADILGHIEQHSLGIEDRLVVAWASLVQASEK